MISKRDKGDRGTLMWIRNIIWELKDKQTEYILNINNSNCLIYIIKLTGSWAFTRSIPKISLGFLL